MRDIRFPDIIEFRIQAGLSISDLSKLTGIDSKIISSLEAGKEIAEETFIKIAEGINKILKKKKLPLIEIDFLVNGMTGEEDDALFF